MWNRSALCVVLETYVVSSSGGRAGTRPSALLALPGRDPRNRPSATPAPQARTLANGLKVVVIEDHAAPVAQVHMWYRFGALDETPGRPAWRTRSST